MQFVYPVSFTIGVFSGDYLLQGFLAVSFIVSLSYMYIMKRIRASRFGAGSFESTTTVNDVL